MPRLGVTYEDVARAAEILEHEGHVPTIERVRAQLGTGSYTTIARLLKDWKQDRQDDSKTHEVALSEEVAQPAEFPQETLDALRGAWRDLEAAAQRQVDDAHAQLQQERERVAALLRTERRERRSAERRYHDETGRTQALHWRLRHQGHQLQEKIAAGDALRAEVHALQVHLQELRDHSRRERKHYVEREHELTECLAEVQRRADTQVSQLRAELDHTRSTAERETQYLHQVTLQQQVEHAKDRQNLEQRLSELAQRIDTLKQERSATVARCQRLARRLTAESCKKQLYKKLLAERTSQSHENLAALVNETLEPLDWTLSWIIYELRSVKALTQRTVSAIHTHKDQDHGELKPAQPDKEPKEPNE